MYFKVNRVSYFLGVALSVEQEGLARAFSISIFFGTTTFTTYR